jgi:hypothetical protein
LIPYSSGPSWFQRPEIPDGCSLFKQVKSSELGAETQCGSYGTKIEFSGAHDWIEKGVLYIHSVGQLGFVVYSSIFYYMETFYIVNLYMT